MKKYKVMAYVLSSGLWDAFGHVQLEHVIGTQDKELERDLKQWQLQYDRQFKRYPYDFDWDEFNEIGRSLTERIRQKAGPHTKICYEDSDDREFFSKEDCFSSPEARFSEAALRDMKRNLVHVGI